MYLLCLIFKSFLLNIYTMQASSLANVWDCQQHFDDSRSSKLLFLHREIFSVKFHLLFSELQRTLALPVSFSRNKLGSFPQLTPTCWALWSFSTFVFEVSREALRETQAFMCRFSLTSAFITEADTQSLFFIISVCFMSISHNAIKGVEAETIITMQKIVIVFKVNTY